MKSFHDDSDESSGFMRASERPHYMNNYQRLNKEPPVSVVCVLNLLNTDHPIGDYPTKIIQKVLNIRGR